MKISSFKFLFYLGFVAKLSFNTSIIPMKMIEFFLVSLECRIIGQLEFFQIIQVNRKKKKRKH